MTREDIRSNVEGMVENAIENIFLNMQYSLNVTDGFIDPWDSYKLDTKESEITELITDILLNQPREEER
jgi:hypothetical protein